MISKKRLFIENMFVYGFGGAITYAIPIIMTPVITWVMPDSSYVGIADMAGIIVWFGSIVAGFGMYDAMYRLFFEKDDLTYKREVCSTALAIVFFVSIIVLFALTTLQRGISKIVFHKENLSYLVLICAMTILAGSIKTIVSAPSRMQNKRSIYLLVNSIMPVLSYVFAIVLLLRGHYYIALPLGTMISTFISSLIFFSINRIWFDYHQINTQLIKSLVQIAVPLIPSSIIYWLFSSADRLMIVHFLGVQEEGIYSVGAKLGHISQLIYISFSGGWQYFLFSNMKNTDQVETTSHLFEYLGIISLLFTSLMCIVTPWLYRILFNEMYIRGYIIAPYMFISPLLLMLYQVEASQFLVVRKTIYSPLILASGAAINALLNGILIPRIGIEGAAIATVCGYSISIILCTIVLRKMSLININFRFWIACITTLIYFVIWRIYIVEHLLYTILLIITLIITFSILYNSELAYIFSHIKENKVHRQ